VTLNEKLGHRPDNFGLTMAADTPVTGGRRQYMLVSQILGPSLVFLGVSQSSPPRSVRVFRKLCGLNYGRPAVVNDSLKMVSIGLALLQGTADRSAPIAFPSAKMLPGRHYDFVVA